MAVQSESPGWFHKSPAELEVLFTGCSFSWEEVTSIVSAVRNGDHCSGRGIRRGWELYDERAGARRTSVELCRLLATWAVQGAAQAQTAAIPGVSWEISAADARGLLANAFWGNLTDPMRDFKESRNRGGLSFARLYDGFNLAAEKMACLWCYFDAVADDVSGTLCFESISGPDAIGFLASASLKEDLLPLKVHVHQGCMEDVEADGIMNFAKKNFGYGKVIESATQEEVLLACHPELHVGMLIFAQMADNEVILVHGVRRFSILSPEACFVGRTTTLKCTTVLTADACLKDHFSEANNARDVLKAHLVFSRLKSVSSGRWGCGAFGGNVQHKLLQQIIAARLAGLHTLHFSAYHDEVFAEVAKLLAGLCSQRSLSELICTLRKYSELARSKEGPRLSLIQFLQLTFPDDHSCCILLNHGSFNPVHQSHIAMMSAAKRVAESAGYTVVKAILAPTSPEYLASKAQYYKNIEVMSEHVRAQALDAAIKPYGHWLEVDKRGMNESSGGAMLRKIVLPELESAGLSSCVGFNVAGADVIDQPRKHGIPCIFVDRICDAEPTASLAERIAEVNKEREVPHLFVPRLPGRVSSTAVRDALKRGDEVAVKNLCGPLVAALLWQAKVSGVLWNRPLSKWSCGRRNQDVGTTCTLL